MQGSTYVRCAVPAQLRIGVTLVLAAGVLDSPGGPLGHRTQDGGWGLEEGGRELSVSMCRLGRDSVHDRESSVSLSLYCKICVKEENKMWDGNWVKAILFQNDPGLVRHRFRH